MTKVPLSEGLGSAAFRSSMLPSGARAARVVESQVHNVESDGLEVERLNLGMVPKSHKYRTIGGCGSGRVCALCGAAIPKERMEIEVEYGPESQLDSFVLHVKCFSAWLGTVGAGVVIIPDVASHEEHVMFANKDQTKGRAKQAKGKNKEITGQLVSYGKLGTKGKIEKHLGKVQATIYDSSMM